MRSSLYKLPFSALFLLVHIFVSAQSETITISLSDTTVEAVLNEIRNQTDFDFIFNHEELAKCPRVSIKVADKTVEEVLTQCLKNTGLSYEKVNQAFIITPQKEEIKASSSRLPTQTVRGIVRDRESKFPMPFASIEVLNTDPRMGTMTDLKGVFELTKVPVGRYSIRVTYVGYEHAVLSEVVVGSAKEVVLSIDIEENSQSIGEVSVTSKQGEPLNQMVTVSGRSFNVEETKRYPASISDPARMAQVFAGVAGTDDSKNEMVIRGNSPQWMVWKLEGVEIPSPNHFAEEGYTSGSVSILSTNMIGVSDFYTGAFPAEYGGALSGVFDIKLRKGNSQETEFTFQAGLLGMDFSAEGPFKKGYDGSYLFNYRYSTFSLMDNLNIQISENALPSYQDLSFKFNLPTKKAGTFSLWALGGASIDREEYTPDTLNHESLENGYQDFTRTGMYAAGLSHTLFPDEKSYIRTVVSHSLSYSSEEFDLMDSLGVMHPEFYDELQNKALRISSLYNRKISSRLTLRTGLTLNHLTYNFFSQQADSTSTLKTFLDSEGQTHLFQVYGQTKYKLTDQLLFTAGLHYAYFHLSNDHSLEPRFGLVYKLPRQQSVSFGFGRHSKNENLPVYFVEYEEADGTISRPNISLKMTRSTHYIVGYNKTFNRDINMKVEAYYQDIDKLPVPDNPDKYWSPIFGGLNPGDTLSNIGEGRNYGIELSLQKYFTQGYYFLLTSSLFDSKYKPADGNWYNTQYNKNYITNLVGGKEFSWGGTRMVGINGRLLWSGGRRITPIDLEASIEEGRSVYEWDQVFSERASDYFRIDLSFNIHFYKKRSEHVISLDIQNLTNRLNTWTEYYDHQSESIMTYPMAGIIPILNYRVEF